MDFFVFFENALENGNFHISNMDFPNLGACKIKNFGEMPSKTAIFIFRTWISRISGHFQEKNSENALENGNFHILDMDFPNFGAFIRFEITSRYYNEV